MSQYTNFFLRGNDDYFYSLGDFGRGSAIAQVANEYLPNKYDIARNISNLLEHMQSKAKEAIKDLEDRQIAQKGKIVQIERISGGSLDEKLEAIRDCEQFLKELEEEKECYKYAKNFFSFLDDISYSNAVYAGIECGDQPEEVEAECASEL